MRNTARFLTTMLLLFPAVVQGTEAMDQCRTRFQQGMYDLAVKPCTEAAQQGNLDAQTWLGLLYTKGRGVQQDYVQAAKWKRMAAMQGNATAQFAYGRMFEQGLGVKQDYAEAMQWYLRASAQGNVDARYSIGNLYRKGYNGKKDLIKAYAWYSLAAEQGMYLAQEARDKAQRELNEAQIKKALALTEQLRQADRNK